MHVWARQNPTNPMSIMGLFTVEAAYFPFVCRFMFGFQGLSTV